MITNPRFFIGKVINNIDPMELSRVQVKIFGEHDQIEDAEILGALPWSLVMFPNGTPGTDGGSTSLGLKKNSTVFGLYMNESDTLILGCIQSSSMKIKPTPIQLAEIRRKKKDRLTKPIAMGGDWGPVLGDIKYRESVDRRPHSWAKDKEYFLEYKAFYMSEEGKKHPDYPRWKNWYDNLRPDHHFKD